MTYDSVKLTEFVGTPLYQSPEQIDGLHYNEKVDIFAMGLILYEMCSSFRTGMERRESLESLKNDLIISSFVKNNFACESNLISWMTNKKPSDRPSASAIIESEIFVKWKNEIEAIKNV
jgi:serine/threonine protein kinase